MADFQANPSVFGASDREKINRMKDTDCYFLVETTTLAGAPLGVGSVAAATSCKTDSRNYGLYSLGIEIATARTDMTWCWNGTTAWHDEASDYEWCRVTTAPLWGGASDWCGASTNYAATISMGQNFHVFAYSAPWWNRYGWTRWSGSKTGVSGADTGFCCN